LSITTYSAKVVGEPDVIVPLPGPGDVMVTASPSLATGIPSALVLAPVGFIVKVHPPPPPLPCTAMALPSANVVDDSPVDITPETEIVDNPTWHVPAIVSP